MQNSDPPRGPLVPFKVVRNAVLLSIAALVAALCATGYALYLTLGG